MAKSLEYATRLKLPSLPNFITLSGTFAVQGAAELPKIDVADLDDDTLRAIGVQWTDALVQLAAERRAGRVGRPTPR